MSNYEIMLILDPSSDEKVVSEIAKSTFSSKDIKIEKMERTELAYEINKSKTAIYFLINVKASGEEINEFTRKTNIAKNIWRILSINLDSEKGLNRKAKPKKIKKASFNHKKSTEKTTEIAVSGEKKSKEEKPKKVTIKKAEATKEEKPKKAIEDKE